MDLLTKCITLVISSALFLIFYTDLPFFSSGSVYTPTPVSTPHIAPLYESHWVSHEETREAHSANITMAGNTPVAVWYGGTEEGHADVALFISTFSGNWSEPVAFVDRATTQQGLNRFIRKVGNPVTHVWPDGALGVFYVSVSMGGWGASAINYVETLDLGATFSSPRRLVTSPFLNISTLVRTQPLQLQDGSIELPVYHEFIGKFSESLHVSRDLRVLDKRRISWGKNSLQPAIASLSDSESLALLRYAGDAPGRVLAATSKDAGETWTTPARLELPNPNSAVALLNTGDGNLLLALNDTEDGRHRLSLALRPVTGSAPWQILKVVEEAVSTGEEEFEFSYPGLTMDRDGAIHLVYTWNQRRIKHVRFNTRWLHSKS